MRNAVARICVLAGVGLAPVGPKVQTFLIIDDAELEAIEIESTHARSGDLRRDNNFLTKSNRPSSVFPACNRLCPGVWSNLQLRPS